MTSSSTWGAVTASRDVTPTPRGLPLDHWLVRAHAYDEALDIMLAAGEELAAAHARGVVHRDFRPGNVVLGRHGQVLVVNFGCARHAHALSRETSTHGAPAYEAPECDSGEAVGPAADQFSFCVTLFEALVGTRPFVASNDEGLRRAVHRGHVTLPGHHTVPRRLLSVILRGLDPDPHKRWPSMQVLLARLRHARRRWSRLSWSVGAGVTIAGLIGLIVAAAPTSGTTPPTGDRTSSTPRAALGITGHLQHDRPEPSRATRPRLDRVEDAAPERSAGID